MSRPNIAAVKTPWPKFSTMSRNTNSMYMPLTSLVTRVHMQSANPCGGGGGREGACVSMCVCYCVCLCVLLCLCVCVTVCVLFISIIFHVYLLHSDSLIYLYICCCYTVL